MSAINFQEYKKSLKARNVASDIGIKGYRFYDLSIGGESKIRFLPDLDESNQLGFVRERITHTFEVNGIKQVVPCLIMAGEDCPVCKASKAFYNAKDDLNGKKYWRLIEYVANALIIIDGTNGGVSGQVMPIQLRSDTWDIIKRALTGDDLAEYPCDYKLGYDFFIKKRKSGQWPDYKSSEFARVASSLDDETIDRVKKQLINLNSLIPVNPGLTAIEAMLDTAINGVKTAPVITDDDGDDGDDDEDAKAAIILAQLRSRRAS